MTLLNLTGPDAVEQMGFDRSLLHRRAPAIPLQLTALSFGLQPTLSCSARGTGAAATTDRRGQRRSEQLSQPPPRCISILMLGSVLGRHNNQPAPAQPATQSLPNAILHGSGQGRRRLEVPDELHSGVRRVDPLTTRPRRPTEAPTQFCWLQDDVAIDPHPGNSDVGHRLSMAIETVKQEAVSADFRRAVSPSWRPRHSSHTVGTAPPRRNRTGHGIATSGGWVAQC